jgi:arylsulfatase A
MMNLRKPSPSRHLLPALASLAMAATPISCNLGPAPIEKESSQPNVVVIFTDDQGYQDLGVYGSPDIKTPNIDRLASEGMRFTDFYSADPVCTPSRAALLTGCYPQRVGNLNVLWPDSTVGLAADEWTLAEMLKANGYATACIGKWHLGHLPQFLPMAHGFDSYFGIPYSNDMSIGLDMKLAPSLELREGVTRESMWEAKKNWVPLMRQDEVIEYPADQGTLTQRYTEEALQFIRSNRDRPFFLYLPHTMPHIPLYASPDFEGKSEIGLYGDCIEEIDWSVGQIADELRRLGLAENTLLIYTSDNGPWDLKGNATDKVKGNLNRRIGGSADPLRGHKFTTWEGGMRVPAVMWWPKTIPAGQVCTDVAATIDLLPTVAQISPGAKLPTQKIDGTSLLPLILGEANPPEHPPYFYRTEAVRVGKWKGFWKKKEERFLLFDLEADMSEKNDVANQHPEVAAKLRALLAEHEQELTRNSRPCGELQS